MVVALSDAVEPAALMNESVQRFAPGARPE